MSGCRRRAWRRGKQNRRLKSLSVRTGPDYAIALVAAYLDGKELV